MRRILHHALYHRDRGLYFRFWRLEHKFVMHLQEHFCRKIGRIESGVHSRHGATNNVGCGALNRRVDRSTLKKRAVRGV